MPRRPPDPVPSARALAILARGPSRAASPDDGDPRRADVPPDRPGGGRGQVGDVRDPDGQHDGRVQPTEPEWVRAPTQAYVPTRSEVAGTEPPPGRVAWSDIVRLPSALWDARWMPNRRAVIGALLLVVLAIGVFGLRVAWARADGAPRAVQVGAPGATVVPATRAPGGTATSRPTGTATPGDAPGPTTGPSGPALVVHVVGRVRHPGIVTLPPGARVVDAVEAAGGAARGADLSAINLARLVVDGEQIRVPRPGEIVATAPTGAGAMGSAPSGSALVSLNTADAASLDGLPGIGPVLAQRILDWRAENGRFTTVDELGEVSGIGEKLLAQLRPKVTV